MQGDTTWETNQWTDVERGYRRFTGTGDGVLWEGKKEGNMGIVKATMNMTAKERRWDIRPERLVACGRMCLEKSRR